MPRTHEELCAMADVTKKTCGFCKKRQGTSWWCDGDGVMDFIHGMGVPCCDRCALEKQLAHALAMAATIPKLKADLAEIDRTEAGG
jgi:hypothetical protein